MCILSSIVANTPLKILAQDYGSFALTETEEINPAALSQAYLNSYTLYPDMLDYARGLQKNTALGFSPILHR